MPCIRHNVWTNRRKYLLWSSSSTQLDDVCNERCRNRLQSVSNGNCLPRSVNGAPLLPGKAFDHCVVFQVNFGPFPIGKCEMLQTVNEDWWPIEARSAASSHSFYTVALNRIGIEKFNKSGESEEKVVGPFFGSTYITAPDGCRTKVFV